MSLEPCPLCVNVGDSEEPTTCLYVGVHGRIAVAGCAICKLDVCVFRTDKTKDSIQPAIDKVVLQWNRLSRRVHGTRVGPIAD